MTWISEKVAIDNAWYRAEMHDFERQSELRRRELARWWIRRVLWNLKARNR